MHPILASRLRVLIYALAWLPLTALLAYACWGAGKISGADAAAELAPACVVFAFACLSPWYVCRALPLRAVKTASLAVTFVLASAAASLVLMGCARFIAYLLEKPAPSLALIFGMGVLLYLVSVGLHYAALAIENSREAEQREAEARTLAREAELRALRYQLNPHFLFNSLHSISALAMADGRRAREMCIRLADFLRSSLGLGQRENIPLREELALARSYLDVERARFGDMLRVEEEIETACEDCPVPALLLQPLIENAVKHGISGLVDGGSIRLRARRGATGVAITVENAFDADSVAKRGAGVGLEHVRRRLWLRFGENALFEAGAADGVYRVSLRFPCE